MKRNDIQFSVVMCAVFFLMIASILAGCDSRENIISVPDYECKQGSIDSSRYVYDCNINGTHCVVYMGFEAGSITCDWNRK